jgi:cold shock CspA family protein
MERKYAGVVVKFHEQGYGFIFNDEINRRIFFHIRNWNRATDPVVGDEVSFELVASPKPGKPEIAVNVTPTGLNAFAAAKASVGGAE